MSFHGLGAFAEECLVALAANEGEVLIAPGLLKDELGQFLFGVLRAETRSASRRRCSINSARRIWTAK